MEELIKELRENAREIYINEDNNECICLDINSEFALEVTVKDYKHVGLDVKSTKLDKRVYTYWINSLWDFVMRLTEISIELGEDCLRETIRKAAYNDEETRM